jgi:SAM-dependent methyltransferase
MDALTRWRADLQARAIPTEILDAAPESPWGFPTGLFRSRAERATQGPPTPTTAAALEALPEGGRVLDVGCGGGATSRPLADRAGLVIGIDGSADMLDVFRETVGGVAAVETIEGGWPAVAPQVAQVDVAVCGHVLYNVPDLAPFAAALDAAAARVVLELTEHHPLWWMNDLWRRFHDVTFPDGPTAALAAEALAGLGYEVRVARRDTSRGHAGVPTRDDAVAMIRRRLCLPADRDDEVAAALGDRLHESDAGWSAGPADQEVVTIWWDAGRGPATGPRG